MMTRPRPRLVTLGQGRDRASWSRMSQAFDISFHKCYEYEPEMKAR